MLCSSSLSIPLSQSFILVQDGVVHEFAECALLFKRYKTRVLPLRRACK